MKETKKKKAFIAKHYQLNKERVVKHQRNDAKKQLKNFPNQSCSKQISARQLALSVLIYWQHRQPGASANKSLDFKKIFFIEENLANNPTFLKIKPQERAFCQKLVYGVVRHFRYLGRLCDIITNRSRLDLKVKLIFFIALEELIFLDKAAFAAVSQAVDLSSQRNRAFVNAILRKFCRNKDGFVNKMKKESLGIRYSMPAFLLKKWQNCYGDDTTLDLLKIGFAESDVFIRINQLKKISKRDLNIIEKNSEKVVNLGIFYKCNNFNIDIRRLLQEGKIYAQDPSTFFAVKALKPKKNERILDACASPGGKSGLIAQFSYNKAELIACDLPGERFLKLHKNLKNLGVKAKMFPFNWEQISPGEVQKKIGLFDKILFDCPCSNSGAISRRVGLRWRLRPEFFIQMKNKQLFLLKHLFELLKIGGKICYSSCSIEVEENQQVVCQFLATNSNAAIVSSRLILPKLNHNDGAFYCVLKKIC